jgi:hypothetical protein
VHILKTSIDILKGAAAHTHEQTTRTS